MRGPRDVKGSVLCGHGGVVGGRIELFCTWILAPQQAAWEPRPSEISSGDDQATCCTYLSRLSTCNSLTFVGLDIASQRSCTCDFKSSQVLLQLWGPKIEHIPFFQTFQAFRDILAKILGCPAKKFAFPGFRRTYRTIWPPPLHVKDPHPTRRYPGPKSSGLGFFFLPDF